MAVIDEQGRQIDQYDIHLNSHVADAGERFRSLVIDWHMCFDVFGLIRAEALRQTPARGNYGHGDGVLLARLGLMGKFHKIPDFLFFSRRHSQQSMRVFGHSVGEGGNDYHAYAEWFDPAHGGKLVFPQWRIFLEYYKTIWQPALAWPVRARAHLYLLWWAAKTRRHLWNDVRVAARAILHRARQRQKTLSPSQKHSVVNLSRKATTKPHWPER